jgi:hypothetical protein
VILDSELWNTTDETAFRVYHFDLDILGPYSRPSDFLSSNTLPSNTSNSCFPGFFHSEPSSRLLALHVEIPNTDSGERVDVPHVLYVPHDVLLDFMRSHPSDADTVVVPWEEWGPGNAHILTSFKQHHPYRVTFLERKIVCGMHTMTDPPIVIVRGDQRMLRIMDYHPRRIFRNSVTGTGTQDTHLRGTADSHKGLDPPGTSARQEATDKTVPCGFKDITLPGGLLLENVKCVLGEDVVVVFEVGIPSLSMVQ